MCQRVALQYCIRANKAANNFLIRRPWALSLTIKNVLIQGYFYLNIKADINS